MRVGIRFARMMLLAGALLGGTLWLGLLDGLDDGILDRFFGLRGPRLARSPIVVVVYDDETLKLLGPSWPPARAVHATLLRKLNEAPPAVVAFDLVFAEPSPRGASDDDALAAALGETRGVVLASYIATTSMSEAGATYVKTVNRSPLPMFPRVAVGHVNQELDDRGIVRRMTLFSALGGKPVPSLGRETARVARGLAAGGTAWDSLDGALIDFRGGPEAFRSFTYQQIVNGAVPSEAWRDRIVLVGVAALRHGDWRMTSFSRHSAMAGVLVHANVVDGLLTNRVLREPSLIVRLGVALVVLGLVVLGAARSAATGTVLAAGAVAFAHVVSYVLFARGGWWIAPAILSGAVLLGLFLAWIGSATRGRDPVARDTF